MKLKNNFDSGTDVFNDHFLRKTIFTATNSFATTSHCQLYNSPASISLYLCRVTREEINLYLSNLKTNIAPGYDELPPRLLKLTPQCIDTT